MSFFLMRRNEMKNRMKFENKKRKEEEKHKKTGNLKKQN